MLGTHLVRTHNPPQRIYADYVDSGAAASNELTTEMPVHQSGDLLLAFSYERQNSTAGTITDNRALPAGWTEVQGNHYVAGDYNLFTLAGGKIASSSSETSGTWWTAEGLLIASYRAPGGDALVIPTPGSRTNIANDPNGGGVTFASLDADMPAYGAFVGGCIVSWDLNVDNVDDAPSGWIVRNTTHARLGLSDSGAATNADIGRVLSFPGESVTVPSTTYPFTIITFIAGV